jgi:hypothetical protein
MTEHQTQDAGLAEGLLRREQAVATFEARREVLLLRARRGLLLHALEAGHATPDDVRAVVDVPDGKDPCFFGDVGRYFAKAGLCRCVGRVRSSRPEAHGREILVWAIANREAVLAWLRAHPDHEAPKPGTQTQLPLFGESVGREAL